MRFVIRLGYVVVFIIIGGRDENSLSICVILRVLDFDNGKEIGRLGQSHQDAWIVIIFQIFNQL